MSLAIHARKTVDTVKAALTFVIEDHSDYTIRDDYDSWREWGEKPTGADGEHLVVIVPDDEAEGAVTHLAATGQAVAVTAANDWSLPVTVSTPHRTWYDDFPDARQTLVRDVAVAISDADPAGPTSTGIDFQDAQPDEIAHYERMARAALRAAGQ